MDKIVGAHNNEIEIAKTIDEITHHLHVIPVTLPIQAIYGSGATHNSPAVVKADLPPADKVRQSPPRASGKIREGVKCFDAIAVEICDWPIIKQANLFHSDGWHNLEHALYIELEQIYSRVYLIQDTKSSSA